MNREQYMKLLKRRLRHLPKEEFDKAVAYFEEYFDEAGAGREQQAIRDLGMPEEAAAQIIQNIAIRNTAEPVSGVKKGMNAVWVGILALFAAPFTVPFFAAALLTALVMILMALLLLAMFFLTGVLLLVSGPICVAGGFCVIGESLGAALICFGRGMAGAGLGLLLMRGLYLLLQKCLNWLVRICGTMIRKGEEKDA